MTTFPLGSFKLLSFFSDLMYSNSKEDFAWKKTRKMEFPKFSIYICPVKHSKRNTKFYLCHVFMLNMSF